MFKVYIDGASAGDPGPSGAGVFINSGQGNIESFALPLGFMSNHEAEYMACIKALELCIDKQYKALSFRTDSLVLEQSINQTFINNKRFQPYLAKILSLINDLDLFFIKWIPSKQNKEADRLAREGIQKN